MLYQQDYINKLTLLGLQVSGLCDVSETGNPAKRGLDRRLYVFPNAVFRNVHLVLALKILPDFRRSSAEPGKTQGRVCRYAAPPKRNLVHAPKMHAPP